MDMCSAPLVGGTEMEALGWRNFSNCTPISTTPTVATLTEYPYSIPDFRNASQPSSHQ